MVSGADIGGRRKPYEEEKALINTTKILACYLLHPNFCNLLKIKKITLHSCRVFLLELMDTLKVQLMYLFRIVMSNLEVKVLLHVLRVIVIISIKLFIDRENK